MGEEVADFEDFPKILKDTQIDPLMQQEEEDATMREEKKGMKSKAAEGAKGSRKKKKTKRGGEFPEEDQLRGSMAGFRPRADWWIVADQVTAPGNVYRIRS